MSLEERVKASSRRGSAVEIVKNPLESGQAQSVTLKVELLNDARPINPDELASLIKSLKDLNNNNLLLEKMETDKQPFLFQTTDLLKLLDITTSVKTKIGIIGAIGPRLIDPRAQMDHIIGMFRYAEEKNQVEEIFKARIQHLNASLFKKSALTPPGAGRGGGRGRGPAGRSPLNNRSGSLPPSTSPPPMNELIEDNSTHHEEAGTIFVKSEQMFSTPVKDSVEAVTEDLEKSTL